MNAHNEDDGELLYRREDSESAGRHLVATRAVKKGRLLWCERPLLAMQSLDNRRYALVCHSCYAFCGGPNAALQHRFQQEIEEVTPCRFACGHVYCSAECEVDAWETHHRHLCTGPCTSDDAPLVLFKQLAVQTNEILLLVAEWWVTQHTNNDSKEYADFQDPPWWEVETADLKTQPGGFIAASELETTLRRICQDAAALLQQALPDDIPPISDLDIAKRIGACAQNAMGIRQRHPLCRNVFERSVRERWHTQLVQAIQEAGFIGGGGENEEGANKGEAPEEEEWDYSVDEIASFLSDLFVEEDGTVRDLAQQEEDPHDSKMGDDFDYMFPPLDGTAMYATICKMNHSCDPNAIVLYKRRGYGAKQPLTAYCVALQDIAEGEELTISYIGKDEPREERQAALVNYGFQCNCLKCQNEASPQEAAADTQVTQEEDPFGSDDDDDDDEEEDLGDDQMKADGEADLQRVIEYLDTTSNHSCFGSIPVQLVAPSFAFLIQTAATLTHASIPSEISDSTLVMQLLSSCSDGASNKDFCLCKIVGCDLEHFLYTMLQRDSSWPSTFYREAYWCSVVAAAIGYAHECSFLESLSYIDKGLILGLPRSDKRLTDLIAYVERHAFQMTQGPNVSCSTASSTIPDYREPKWVALLLEQGLSRPIEFGVAEQTNCPSLEKFQQEHVVAAKPLVVRQLASEWDAVTMWRHLDFFIHQHGHRLVPVELGSMLDGTIKEEIQTFRFFVSTYLLSSEPSCWSLQAATIASAPVAYLAQHPLLDQISSLRRDLPMKLELCGAQGPSHVYLWMGTGGTRTPLHFDSYDNLFVQVVGAKYIRLYGKEETSKLYVGEKSAYGLQGNLSEVDCEREDKQKHPLATTASYEEVLLLPGDCLFIPARTWHYVRSLSTSISVNYWF
jgi:hypothetical protein